MPTAPPPPTDRLMTSHATSMLTPTPVLRLAVQFPSTVPVAALLPTMPLPPLSDPSHASKMLSAPPSNCNPCWVLNREEQATNLHRRASEAKRPVTVLSRASQLVIVQSRQPTVPPSVTNTIPFWFWYARLFSTCESVQS